jgi:hypothetical protein
MQSQNDPTALISLHVDGMVFIFDLLPSAACPFISAPSALQVA